jgi:hypothetical protein
MIIFSNSLYNKIIVFSFSFAFVIIFLSIEIFHIENLQSVNAIDPKLNQGKRIAFVEPTFTYAAYQTGSFYNFYKLYTPMLGKNNNITITTNLNLLKDRPIPNGPFLYFDDPTYTRIPYIEYFKLLLQHVKKDSPSVTNITDVDVDSGKIFQTDGKNLYDILFLFHNEYLTQNEYTNLKNFVLNGGTIVFTEANALYAEVSYNNASNSITLVNGHNWQFNGKVAKGGINERWLNENKEWVGSNFLDIPSNKKVYFANNPFNYTHSEEQYVTNPNAKILINYQAYNLTDGYPNDTIVATHTMNSGKGKIINLGIWGHTLTKNKAFLDYFDNVIIPLAFGSTNNIPKIQTLFSNTSIRDSNEVSKTDNSLLTPS